MNREEEKQKAQTWFEQIAKCSYDRYPPPGITRPSYSPKETDVLDLIEIWATASGLRASRDYANNLHCLLPGNDEPAIAFGSHVDSVPNGGRYDGVAGVVAGICVIDRVLAQEGPYQGPPLQLIVLRGEESAWFGQCYIGSLALFGKLPPGALDLPLQTPGHGTPPTLEAMMRQAGAHVARVREGLHGPTNISRFYEVHIEQGPVLPSSGFPVGIVSSIRGNVRFLHAVARGVSGHSGAVPMEDRLDAVLNFAQFLTRLETDLDLYDHPTLTCGVASTNPQRNAVSIIADEMKFKLEIRASTEQDLRGLALRARLHAGPLSIDLGTPQVTAPVELDASVQQELLRAAFRVDPTRSVPTLPSGAGHDAAVFQENGIPTGMIFIRNEHGSHNPQEAMELD